MDKHSDAVRDEVIAVDSRCYRFGPFRLYPAEHLLLRGDRSLPLAPKAFELLVTLVEGHGRLMRREDLLEAVWRDSFVEEINLTVNISLLRKTLGEAPEGSSYIVTVPKRGYRFGAPVVEDAGELRHEPEIVPSAVPSASLNGAGLPSTVQSPPRQETITPAPNSEKPSADHASRRSYRVWLPLGLLALTLVTTVGIWLWQSRLTSSRSGIHSVAVLPFGYIGSDPAFAYLGLGMTDALVTRLGGQDRLMVRPISAVRRFAGAPDLVKAGTDLHVDAVLDGTVQRLTAQTRVTVRLVRIPSGEVVWADTFDQANGSEFALEDAISQRLAQALTLHLTEDEERRLAVPHTRSPEAYALYTQGRVALNNRSVESLTKSLDLFRGAIFADPKYAAAYAGLADAYILAGSYGNSFLAPSVAAPKAEEAVGQALALNPSSAEAHTSRAYLRLTYDWDWTGAEQDFREAIRLDPTYVNAHHWYAHELLAQGRRDEARRQSEQALALDPTDVVVNEHMAWHHLFAREYKSALTQALKAVEIDPAFVQAHRVLGLAYLYTGDTARATAEFQTGIQLSHQDPVALAYLARCFALSKRPGEARAIAADLESAARTRYISPAEIAAIYAALGERNTALHWLDEAVNEHASALIYLGIDPIFDPLRADPAFQSVLARVGL